VRQLRSPVRGRQAIQILLLGRRAGPTVAVGRAHQRSEQEQEQGQGVCERGERVKALHDPSCGLQPRSVNGIEMRDHVRPPGFSGLARNNETDAAHHAARDDGPAAGRGGR